MPHIAILLATHRIDDTVVEQYRKLQAEAGPECSVFVLYDNSQGNWPAVSAGLDLQGHPFSWDEIYARGYKIDFYRRGDLHWLGHNDLTTLSFWRANPDYDFYWFIEYDVRFSGHWRRFFDEFHDNRADLLTTTLVRKRDVPDFYWWASFKSPKWFFRQHHLLRAFLPVYRISQQACALLDATSQAGWRGHHEVKVPTVLLYHGLQLEDLGGRGEFVPHQRVNKFYTNDPTCAALDSGTFRFRPVMEELGLQSDMLWHPVKPGGDRRDEKKKRQS